MALSLCVLARALSKMFNAARATLIQFCAGGNYVNFGVFSLYQDKALDNALDIGLQMCLSFPLGDVMVC